MVDSIHEKMALARQLASLKLSQKPEYKFNPIPQSVLDAETKRYMGLSVQELQKQINGIPNLLSGSSKPKDGWELMGFHYTNEQKATAHKNISKINAELDHRFKNKKVPKQNAIELTKEIEASREQKNAVKMTPEETKKYIAQKIWKAYDNKDAESMANSLYEFYEYECQDLDKKIGLNDFKKALTKYTGADALSNFIHKKVNDGDHNHLSVMERIISSLDGISEMGESFVGTEGITMGVALGGASKVPALGTIIQTTFAAQGSEMVYNGGKQIINGKTEEEVRQGSSEGSMGLLMFTGGLKSAHEGYRKVSGLKSDIKAKVEGKKAKTSEVKADATPVEPAPPKQKIQTNDTPEVVIKDNAFQSAPKTHSIEPEVVKEGAISDVVDNTKKIVSNIYNKTRQSLGLQSEVEKLFDSTTKKSNVRVLKKHSGTKFSDSEVSAITSACSLPVPSKVLYALTKISHDSGKVLDATEIANILNKIDTPDKMKALEIMLKADKIEFKGGNISNNPKTSFTPMDIEDVFNNLDSNVTNFSDLVKATLDNKALISSGTNPATLLAENSTYFKNNHQVEAFQQLLKYSTNKEVLVASSYWNSKMLNNINTEADLQFLKDNLSKAKNPEYVAHAFKIDFQAKPEAKELYKMTLDAKNTNGQRVYSDSDIYFNILRPFADSDIDFNLAKELVNKKISAKDIDMLLKLPKDKIDVTHPVFKALMGDNPPADVGNMFHLEFQNDYQKKALQLLLNDNGKDNARFEALGLKDIIENIKDENDLFKLENILRNKEISTFDIIKSFNNGKDIDGAYVTAPKELGAMPTIKDFSGTKDLTNYLESKNIPSAVAARYATQLLQLKEASPKRFNKMAESGVFELIEAGKISYGILDGIDANSFLSNRTLNDIRKLKNGEPLVKEFPVDTKEAEFLSKVADGDVGTINGKLYVNDNGKLVEMNFSKEKFEELFPPLDRVTFQQGQLGDCYLVTTLDNMMDLPGGRTALYKLFRQDGNDIYIKFPDSNQQIKFTDGKVLDNKGRQINGANGIKMIEQAYAVHRCRAYTADASFEMCQQSVNIQQLMSKLEGGWQHEVVKNILDSKTAIDHYGMDLNNKTTMKNAIIQHASDENTLVFFATKSQSNYTAESLLNKKYDLYSSHAYSIKGYDEKTGMVYLTNPWHTKVVTEVPLYELMKYMDDVNFANLR